MAIDQRTSLEDLMARFGRFGDALLHGIEVAYMDGGQRRVRIRLSAADAEETGAGGWSRVCLEVSGVLDYRFTDERSTTMAVLNFGVRVLWNGPEVGVELHDITHDDLTWSEMHDSRAFVTGTSVSWTIESD